MASKRKVGKGSNGDGDSVTVLFDQQDGQERRALAAAQLLAAKHGRRKQAIVALLEAVYLHYEQTGEILTGTAIATALERGLAAPSMSLASFPDRGIASRNTFPMTDQMPQLPATTGKRIRPKVVQDAQKASAKEVGSSFTSSLAGFLG